MNASEYANIPQNRERIYIVGFLNKEDYKNFDFPKPQKSSKTIFDCTDFNQKVDEKYYYHNFKHYDILKDSMQNNDTVYQWRRHLKNSGVQDLIVTLG